MESIQSGFVEMEKKQQGNMVTCLGFVYMCMYSRWHMLKTKHTRVVAVISSSHHLGAGWHGTLCLTDVILFLVGCDTTGTRWSVLEVWPWSGACCLWWTACSCVSFVINVQPVSGCYCFCSSLIVHLTVKRYFSCCSYRSLMSREIFFQTKPYFLVF